MKTQYKIIATVLVIFAILTSCADSFLEDPLRGLTNQDQFYKTDEDAFQGVVAAYDILQILYAAPWHSPWMLRTLMSDESRCGSNSGDQPPLTALNAYTHGPSNAYTTAAFGFYYRGILRANKVIENVEPDTEEKKNCIAEAKFLRALFHFELVSQFGSVPLVTKELKRGEYQPESATVEAIYAQIAQDLTEAETDLKTKADYSAAHKFRASKEAAIALHGKALLYQKKYDEALTQFNKITGTNAGTYGLSLHSDYKEVLLEASEFGAESLFEISYARGATVTFYWGDHKRNENNVTWQLCGAPLHKDDANTLGLSGGWTFIPGRRTFFDSYEAEDTVRKYTAMIDSTKFRDEYGGVVNAWSTDTENDGILRLRYSSYKDESSTDGAGLEYNRGTNIRLIRYADVLLMAAECEILKASPNYTNARTHINMVRQRVPGLSDRISSGAQLLADLKYERKVELAFEGHRWLDLVRWGDAVDTLSTLYEATPADYYMTYEAKHDLWPIPEQEITNNPNMDQNPLWK